MSELDELIILIQKHYNNINKLWKNSGRYLPLNMKKTRVEDVYYNEQLLFYIFNYRGFINDNIMELVDHIQDNFFVNIVSSRVKSLNSIQYKIKNYKMYHENGKIPLKKCLNDIFGIRIILNEINYEEVYIALKIKYPNLKIIKSVKGNYKAIHIYFGNDNNMNFQWELQVWNKKQEKVNLLSHTKYKQEYTKWEQENILSKGGA